MSSSTQLNPPSSVPSMTSTERAITIDEMNDIESDMPSTLANRKTRLV